MRAVPVLLPLALLVGSAGASASTATRPAAPDVRATVTGDDRTPRAGRPWTFVVRAVDQEGRAVPGTVEVRVLLAGVRVDTIGLFRFSGVLRRTYRWSDALAGAPAVLEATVLAGGSRQTARFEVRVVAETGRPRFLPVLRGDDRVPRAGTPWHFVVRARDARDRPVRGTAIVRVAVAGRVVDTIGWFRFEGVLRGTYRWSSRLRGSPALLQAKVIGPGGTRTVGYLVRVA